MSVARRHDPAYFRARIGAEYGRHTRLYRTVRSGRPEAAAAEWGQHVRDAMRTFLQMHSEDVPAGAPGEEMYPSP